ncbi:metallophosphoesterase [Phreatobacter stygius]|uniref:Phosphatase n=1 Tax=Phreatobacter stygius TaxID=1940610 RepID=A0A4D7B813_9HYPH|nr:metallophosphoesterase [Phreatobacter stygius]QCI64272.1 phosphatase [Phreatobacter stygius]
MITRRNLLTSGAAATLVTPFGGFLAGPARGQAGPLFRFGIVADPQYAPVVPNLRMNRYYANSLWKLSAAIGEFNKHDLRFVATLGDIIDRHWESFGHVLPVYDQLKHERFFLLGNHDYDVANDYLASVVRNTGMPRAYYDFAGGGYRFIILDGNDVSTFAPPRGDARRELAAERLAALKQKNAINAQAWNGSLSDAQFAWLGETMTKAKASGEKVIVMGHYPIYPVNIHNLWDAERIVELLTGFDNFVAYFCGHNHAGNFAEVSGKYFVNFCGMVDTPDTTAYSIVEVHADRLEIRGFGREQNRSLKI